MGLFSGLKNAHFNTMVQLHVQSLLKHQYKNGSLSMDPMKLGEKLVNMLWETLKEDLDISQGKRNKEIVSALALNIGLIEAGPITSKTKIGKTDRLAIMIAQGLLLQNIGQNLRKHKLSTTDLEDLDFCCKRFRDCVAELDSLVTVQGTPIKSELENLYIPSI